MSRQISLSDVLKKLDLNVPRTTSAIRKDDLRKIFMATSGWPVIGSEGTFNEKIRTLVSLEVLVPLRMQAKVYSIKWETIDKILVDLEGW